MGVVAVATFVALVRDRLPALAAAAVGVGGGVTAVLVLESRPVLVNGPFASHAASVAGREVAALLVAVVVATGVAWIVDPVVRRIPTLSRRAAVGLAATVAAALVVAVALSHPLARLHSFTKPPVASDTPSFVRTHLVSGSGSGRWQFWTAESTSGSRCRSSAPARARSPPGGPSTDPSRCSSSTRIRSTSKASAKWEPWASSSRPRSGSAAARSAFAPAVASTARRGRLSRPPLPSPSRSESAPEWTGSGSSRGLARRRRGARSRSRSSGS